MIRLKRKIFSKFEDSERLFGEVKRANKAAKRAELIEAGTRKGIVPDADGTLKSVGIGNDSVDRKIERRRRRMRRDAELDPLTAGRSKADRLKNLSYESKAKIFDKIIK